MKQHIAAGTDVNAMGGMSGGTPLTFAAIAGHKEIVELLIAKGADVEVADLLQRLLCIVRLHGATRKSPNC